MNEALKIARDNMDKEMKSFRDSYNSMEKIQIYNDWYIIGFYEAYYDIFMSDYTDEHLSDNEAEWLAHFENPLGFLYSEWLSADVAFSFSWEDLMDFVHQVYEDCEEN